MRHRVRTIRGHNFGIVTAQFSPDGTRIVTAGWDGTVRVWHVATGREVLMFPQSHSPLLAPNGRHLAMSIADGLRIYHFATPQEASDRDIAEKAIQQHLAYEGMPEDQMHTSGAASYGLPTTLIHPPPEAFVRHWLVRTRQIGALNFDRHGINLGELDIYEPEIRKLRPRAGDTVHYGSITYEWSAQHLDEPVVDLMLFLWRRGLHSATMPSVMLLLMVNDGTWTSSPASMERNGSILTRNVSDKARQTHLDCQRTVVPPPRR